MHFSQPIPVNGHRYQNFYQAICLNRRLITRRQEFSIAMFKLTHRILTNLKAIGTKPWEATLRGVQKQLSGDKSSKRCSVRPALSQSKKCKAANQDAVSA